MCHLSNSKTTARHSEPCQFPPRLFFLSHKGSCTFENGTCGWYNMRGETYTWTLNRGSTPTINSGPSADVTYGSESPWHIDIVPGVCWLSGLGMRTHYPTIGSSIGWKGSVGHWINGKIILNTFIFITPVDIRLRFVSWPASVCYVSYYSPTTSWGLSWGTHPTKCKSSLQRF